LGFCGGESLPEKGYRLRTDSALVCVPETFLLANYLSKFKKKEKTTALGERETKKPRRLRTFVRANKEKKKKKTGAHSND